MTFRNRPLNVIAFGQSDIGLVRKNNEDSLVLGDLTNGIATFSASDLSHMVAESGSFLFAVADGMGGAEAGEVASRMAVESVSQHIDRQLKERKSIDRLSFVNALKESIEYANTAIYEEGQSNDRRRGMGTTFTAAAIYDNAVFLAQVGDSRAYLARNGAITQMTEDQSLIAQMLASGTLTPEKAKDHPQRNVILQALGVREKVSVVVSFAELRRGDWLLLCTDGLWGKVEASELQEVLEKCQGPEDACQDLIATARVRGGDDNITLIAAKLNGEGLPPAAPEDVCRYRRFDEKKGRWRFWPWGKA